jgi:transglutaminase-like putative cysteine protease
MNRRTLLKTVAAAPIALASSRSVARAQQREFDPRPGPWRTFEITTRAEVLDAAGVTRVWIPLPSVDAEYQRTLGSVWSGNAKIMRQTTDGRYGAAMLHAEFADGEKAPVVEVTSRFQTRDRAVDWSRKTMAAEDPAALKKWTEPTEFAPTDGIVRRTAEEITRGRHTDLDKTRAVYDWVLATTYREPTVRGCGVGDVRGMLETKNFGGKCADINPLFVGLLRSVGVPARDVYGIRVAPSAFGYRSLGAGTAVVSRAQHCRAEVYLREYGWVAMDPADVTKVAREETGEWLKMDHPVVQAVRPKLFGAWEGNWLGYNVAHDVALPGATTPGKLAFLMYPQCETAGERRDSLDPDRFKYAITAREIRT